MLILQLHSHSQPFSFIGELVAHTASRPLMDLLIILGTHINVFPQISNIADDHGLHTLLIQCANKSCCLLVFDILDLVSEFPQLFLLRLEEPLAAIQYPFFCVWWYNSYIKGACEIEKREKSAKKG